MSKVTFECRAAWHGLLLACLSLAGLAAGCGSESNDAPGAAGVAVASGEAGRGGGRAQDGASGQPGRASPRSDEGGAGSGSGEAGTMNVAGASVGAPVDDDTRPFFSFFVTSQAGLFGLPVGQSAPRPDPILGFGGDLGGLAGADEICTRLARASNPGDSKVWRAFLSTAGVDGGERVDAIDRIGAGPWYDFNGLELAADVAGLSPDGADGRPRSADPELADMFTDENGEAVRPSGQIDNHDTLTGSGTDGRLFDDAEDGRVATCEDWTSSTLRGQESGPAMGGGGQIPVGHAWPRSANNGRHWIDDHTINGCEPGPDIDGGAGARSGDFRVGAGGGYGGFYCFALGAQAPR